MYFDIRIPTGLPCHWTDVHRCSSTPGNSGQTWPATVRDSAAIEYGQLDLVVDALKSRGWLKGRVGVERWTWTPAAPIKDDLAMRLGRVTPTSSRASWTVDRVHLVASPKELQYTRTAIEIADAGAGGRPWSARAGHP